jgi:hypothetical protein
MRPFILDNDLVEIHPISPDLLKRGDIILCRLDSGRMVLHRIVRGDRASWVIQGDALPQPDGRVSLHQIVGRASMIYRGGNQISLETPLAPLSVFLWRQLIPLRRQLRYCLHLIKTITV